MLFQYRNENVSSFEKMHVPGIRLDVLPSVIFLFLCIDAITVYPSGIQYINCGSRLSTKGVILPQEAKPHLIYTCNRSNTAASHLEENEISEG